MLNNSLEIVQIIYQLKATIHPSFTLRHWLQTLSLHIYCWPCSLHPAPIAKCWSLYRYAFKVHSKLANARVTDAMKNYYSLGLTPTTHQSYRAGLKQYAAFCLQAIHRKSCYLRQAADHERHLQGEMQDHFTKHASPLLCNYGMD